MHLSVTDILKSLRGLLKVSVNTLSNMQERGCGGKPTQMTSLVRSREEVAPC